MKSYIFECTIKQVLTSNFEKVKILAGLEKIRHKDLQQITEHYSKVDFVPLGPPFTRFVIFGTVMFHNLCINEYKYCTATFG